MADNQPAHMATGMRTVDGEGRVYDRERVPRGLRVVRAILAALGILVLGIVILVGVLTATEYRPADSEGVAVADVESAVATVAPGDALTVLTWNIGYCGLSEEADFFMDGGKGVRTVSEEGVRDNLRNVAQTIADSEPDVVFLQEVDRASSRSYRVDEAASLAAGYAPVGFSSAFAQNYRVLFVPFPIPPIGAVDSGILTLNRLAGLPEAERIQLPCPFSWPVRLGNLKRCLLVERVPVEGTDRELVLINLHLEAYDDGEGKAAQTERLVSFMRAEYEKGNYVVAGGDFNQSFSNVDTSAYPARGGNEWVCGLIDVADLGEGFSALMDPSAPTCRSLVRAYDPDDPNFQYYMIDGFIVSDNLAVESVETIDTGFDFSDHNPVRLEVRLAA